MEDLHQITEPGKSGDSAYQLVPDRRLIRNHVTVFHAAQWIAHASAIWIALAIATLHAESGFDSDYRLFGLLCIAGYTCAAHFTGYFRRFVVGWLCIWRVAEVWLLTATFMLLATLLTNTLRRFDPIVLVQLLIFGFILHLAAHLAFRALSNAWHHHFKINIKSIVIGTGPLARNVIAAINRNNFLPDQIVGVVDSTMGLGNWDGIELPVLGNAEDIVEIIRTNKVNRVYFAYPIGSSDELQQLQTDLIRYPVDIVWIPDLSSLNLLNPSIRELGGMPFVSLVESPLISGPKAYLKSLMDLTIAGALLLLLAPVFLIIAALIKSSSPGPVFYKQKRHGWDGAEFNIWKFRSMRLHDESGGIRQAKQNDSRITPIGRILRRTSLDELPQLLNVLNGSMSLVGPRPHAIEHNNIYSVRLKEYMSRHRVKPGMTGWAQIHGHRGETDTPIKMHNRVSHDRYYINNWGLKLDLLILLKTPLALLSENAR